VTIPRFVRPLARVVAASLVCSSTALAQRATAAATATAESSAISAPISDVRYNIVFNQTTAPTRTLRLQMTFTTPGNAPVLLSLPAWTPGAYEMTWFARWVSNFMPMTEERSLDWDKLDHDTWRIHPAGARRITVTWEYLADSLDNAMAWARPDFVLFNGTNIFMYPEGRGTDWTATVVVATESDWLIATGMAPAAPPAGVFSGKAAAFTARNYHDLVDMPFFVGAFDYDSVQVSNVWMRFASYPKGSVAGADRQQVWDQLRRILPPQIAIFRDTPFTTYTTMQIVDSSYAGASGLEHQNSHVDVVSPFAIGNSFMPSLYAHEVFHAWNVKRLRPADLVPYRYDRPTPTTWLWMSEGVTDYYADLTLVRGGVIDSAGFMSVTSDKINEVNSAVTVALEDASLSTWVHPTDGTGYIYYPKGSLAALMLDIMIRDGSDNRRSLDDVLRELYETTYKRGRGFTAAEWWGAVSRAAGGRSFADFNARYIDGRDSYPWAAVLPLAGFRFVSDTIREPRLGVFSQPDSAGIRVTSVEPGSAAMVAGVRAGDYLVSIGDLPVDEQFGARFRAKYGRAPEGGALPLQVKREGQTVTLNSTLRFSVRTQSAVQLDTRPSPKALRIRSGILHGTTTR
jgi:predicted metalloprotease with PDZ domain